MSNVCMHANPRVRWLAAGLILAAATAAGCKGGGEEPSPTPVVAVEVTAVEQGPLQHWIRSEALLYPLHQAVITPKVSAPVSKFYVNRGSPVHAGDRLAELENKDLVAAQQESGGEYQAAQAGYATATDASIPEDLKKAQLDDAAAQKALEAAQRIDTSRQELYRQGAIPRRDLDQAGVDLINAQNTATLARQHLEAMNAVGHAQALKAAQGDLDAARAREAGAAAMVGYSEITSPIDGVVTDRPMWPGELATPASPLMTIMDLSQVVARAHLPAQEAAELKAGDPAMVTPHGSQTPIPATVTLVSPATDPGSTTVEVWVQAANAGGALRPGASVDVAMLARTVPDAVIIPASALLTDTSGETTVMVAGPDSVAHQTAVKVGIEEPDQVQILSGLHAGQRVVSAGAFGLPDNTKIKATTAEPPDLDPDGQ